MSRADDPTIAGDGGVAPSKRSRVDVEEGKTLDAEQLRAATWVFEQMGAHVCVADDLENLVRKRPGDDAGAFEVQAQGLPNLIHELVHALVQDKLDDDHGFPYGDIPLDMQRREHRAQLFEELACCTLSCAFVPRQRVDAWFAEQLEILPVFYGLDAASLGGAGSADAEDSARAFVDLVSETIAAHPDEFSTMLSLARGRLEARLLAGAGALGLDAKHVWPRSGEPFDALWSRYRPA